MTVFPRFPGFFTLASSLLVLLPWTAQPAPESRPAPVAPTPQCLALDDLNGDRAVDLVVLTHGVVKSVTVLLHEDAQLHPVSGRLFPGLPPYARGATRAAVCDVNEDGWPDLILSDASSRTLALFLNRRQLHGEWQGLAETALPKASPQLRQATH